MDDKLKTIIGIFNSVFDELGHTRLEDNPGFQVYELKFDHYRRFDRITQSGEDINLFIDLSSDGVSFHLDRTDEIPEWSFEMIESDEESFRKTLVVILSSKIVAIYQGHKTVLQFLDEHDRQVLQYKFWRGIGLSLLKKKVYRFYRPILQRQVTK